MKHALTNILAGMGLVAAAGCMTPMPTTPAPSATTKQINIPEIVATSDTKVTQGESVKIAVIPVIYTAKVVSRTTYEPTQLAFWEWETPQNSVYVLETIEHFLTVEPEHLRFLVKINNQLDRSFRGAGTVVEFNVDGKVIDVGQLNYRDLLNVIVPPRSEKEVAIYGPSPSNLSPNTAIGVMFYDVVTSTDVAGNVTERQNFQWVFRCAFKEVQQSVPSTVRAKKWIPAERYQEYRMQIQSHTIQQQWQNMPQVPAVPPDGATRVRETAKSAQSGQVLAPHPVPLPRSERGRGCLCLGQARRGSQAQGG